MVNPEESFAGRDPERAIVLAYAPSAARAGFAALLDLDDTLAAVLRGKGEPMLAQMRLTWWHDAISKLDSAPPPAQPVLQALAAACVARGVPGGNMAGMIEGWETLLDAPVLDDVTLSAYAEKRGAVLFDCAARLAGAEARAPTAAGGRGWALADLSRHTTDPAQRASAAALARAELDEAFARPWPAPLRGLGALALRARMDLAVPHDQPVPHGAPRRVARLLWHRMSGR
ncbi:hypothetical protein GO308_06090 [Sphingomonas sp. SFZ2018-12]|uniref:squalene/phytoene synthase family protein n=1 Tax=Sphingomonas sp. SFZ2018-12 TaxID=2683197 RepID=UPI001F1022C6|nr:hypothetical protein [Sphingomonas sp. SFZ2018-12]